MKKLFFIILIILVISLTGCSSSTLKKLSITKLNEKLTNKETFVIAFTGDDNTLKEKLETVLKENDLTGYYIETKHISNEEKIALETNIAFEEPSIVFVIKGTDPSKLSHITNKDITNKDIIERLKDMKFIQSEK